MPRSKNALAWIGVAAVSARVLAWNGAQDEAVTLLDELTHAVPGLLPGQISLDPLYAVPLGNNSRFQVLVARLEEEMRSARI